MEIPVPVKIFVFMRPLLGCTGRSFCPRGLVLRFSDCGNIVFFAAAGGYSAPNTVLSRSDGCVPVFERDFA